MSFSVASRRLAKELVELERQGLPPGISIVSTENMQEWLMDIEVLSDNALYNDKVFRLQFRFNNQYPIEPPEVVFLESSDRPIPMHPHIYSNGIICLDILGSGWSPVHKVDTICMSLQSMLTGNTKNERPPQDDEFVRTNRLPPRAIRFEYHDNDV